MLIEVPSGYSNAAVKLMVVGQVAGGWAESVPWGQAQSDGSCSSTQFALGQASWTDRAFLHAAPRPLKRHGQR